MGGNAVVSRLSPRFLLRFDDICPTMNWAVWENIEATLDSLNVRPILAVVPDNQDSKLKVDAPNLRFWERVRSWQSRGWAIGLHGFQHRYVNGNCGILGLNPRSEFAGLAYDEQAEKISKGLKIFRENGVTADCWVAPAHSFDWVTVSVLAEQGVHTISDGFALSPYVGRNDSVWVPQQFANVRHYPFGTWTFCYHHNSMTSLQLTNFQRALSRVAKCMVSLPEVIDGVASPRSMVDLSVGLARSVVSGVRRFPNSLRNK